MSTIYIKLYAKYQKYTFNNKKMYIYVCLCSKYTNSIQIFICVEGRISNPNLKAGWAERISARL